MLYLECAYRYADVSALMRLVAIEVADNLLSAINNLHLFALCQSDALVAFLPFGQAVSGHTASLAPGSHPRV